MQKKLLVSIGLSLLVYSPSLLACLSFSGTYVAGGGKRVLKIHQTRCERIRIQLNRENASSWSESYIIDGNPYDVDGQPTTISNYNYHRAFFTSRELVIIWVAKEPDSNCKRNPRIYQEKCTYNEDRYKFLSPDELLVTRNGREFVKGVHKPFSMKYKKH